MTIKSFSDKILKSWSGIQEFQRAGWIYRGQRKACRPLRTSLERCFKRHDIPPSRAIFVEDDLLREFRRAYHNYCQYIPEPSNNIEWLSLMQHFGSPTRLLDFTYSIYVAAYFAIETTNNDAAIWAIDAQWAMKESVRLLKAAGKKEKYIQRLQERFTEDSEQISQHLFFDSPIVPLACPLNPFHLNERLRTQKGVFLVPGSIEITFTENLKALKNHKSPDRVIKIIIPASCVKDMLVNLYKMNISRATLFPGLDGYAQSLGVFHPSFKTDEMLWYLNKKK